MIHLTEFYTQPYLVLESPKFERYRSGDDGDWADGIRPPHIVETAQDVDWLMEHSDAERPQMVCGFCADTHQTTSAVAALRWFNTHACKGEGVDAWLAA